MTLVEMRRRTVVMIISDPNLSPLANMKTPGMRRRLQGIANRVCPSIVVVKITYPETVLIVSKKTPVQMNSIRMFLTEVKFGLFSIREETHLLEIVSTISQQESDDAELEVLIARTVTICYREIPHLICHTNEIQKSRFKIFQPWAKVLKETFRRDAEYISRLIEQLRINHIKNISELKIQFLI